MTLKYVDNEVLIKNKAAKWYFEKLRKGFEEYSPLLVTGMPSSLQLFAFEV